MSRILEVTAMRKLYVSQLSQGVNYAMSFNTHIVDSLSPYMYKDVLFLKQLMSRPTSTQKTYVGLRTYYILLQA